MPLVPDLATLLAQAFSTRELRRFVQSTAPDLVVEVHWEASRSQVAFEVAELFERHGLLGAAEPVLTGLVQARPARFEAVRALAAQALPPDELPRLDAARLEARPARRFGAAAVGVALVLAAGLGVAAVLSWSGPSQQGTTNPGGPAGGPAPLPDPPLTPVAREPAQLRVRVIDELLRPLTAASVEIDVGSGPQRLALDDQAAALVDYVVGLPSTARIVVRVDDRETEVELQADAEGRLSDTTVRAWSGERHLDVRHLTANSVVLDALHSGAPLPAVLDERYSALVGVLQNPVYDEVEALLALVDSRRGFPNWLLTMDERMLDRSADGEAAGFDPQDLRAVSHASFVVRPSERTVSFLGDGGLLPPSFLLFLVGAESHYWGDQVPILARDRARLVRACGEDVFDEGGELAAKLIQRLGEDELRELLADPRLEIRDEPKGEDPSSGFASPRAYLQYLADRHAPPGLVVGALHLFEESRWMDGCLGNELERTWKERLQLEGPVPSLRLTLIENVSQHNLPIDALHYQLSDLGGIAPLGETGELREEQQAVPFTVLRPGESMFVPRQLILEPPSMPGERELDRTALGEAPLDLVIQDYLYEAVDWGAPELPEPDRVRQTSLRVPADQLRRYDPAGRSDTLGKQVVGTRIDAVDVIVNGVAIPTREDAGQTLAMAFGLDWGSCPYTFVRREPGGPAYNLGPILTAQWGPESQAMVHMPLGRRVASVEIRELEPETTWLDAAGLVAEHADGSTTRLSARNVNLGRADGRYLRLEQGESVVLDFGPLPEAEGFTLELEGYYEPQVVYERPAPW